jgi:hypothetical protein
MMVFHLVAAAGGGPLVEFLLQLLVGLGMSGNMIGPEKPAANAASDALYCPNCAREVTDPLTCGDCSAVICRVCGTPLESSADLGMG